MYVLMCGTCVMYACMRICENVRLWMFVCAGFGGSVILFSFLFFYLFFSFIFVFIFSIYLFIIRVVFM